MFSRTRESRHSFLAVQPESYALRTSQTIKQITTRVPIKPYPNIVVSYSSLKFEGNLTLNQLEALRLCCCGQLSKSFEASAFTEHRPAIPSQTRTARGARLSSADRRPTAALPVRKESW
jgi:hypothetical protein